jgi:hypothetical protein
MRHKYIFYALFNESKSKEITMKGPFIHLKPSETVKTEQDRYIIIDDNESNKERKYLTQKYINEIVIFKIIESDLKPDHINLPVLFEQAETFFNGKKEMMIENYRICSR